MKIQKQKVQVYFDGLCHLCSREIEHYKKCAGSDAIGFIDITSDDFDAEQEKLDPQTIHRSLHVRKSNGTVVSGVDAFIEIWTQLPAYGWLAKIIQWKPVRWMADVGYVVFAKVRPWLPRRKRNCEASPYCEIEKPGSSE